MVPSLWLAETFLTFSLKRLNGDQRNLTGSLISISFSKFVFFGPIRKKDVRPSLWFQETKSWSNSPLKLLYRIQRHYKKQEINVLLVFSGRSENQDDRPELWLTEICPLPLLNRWKVFDENWQEARSERPLPSSCFSGRSENKDYQSGLWLVESFSTSPLKPQNKIWRDVTGSKTSMSSTKFIFFRAIGKKRWPPCPVHQHRWHFVLICTIWGHVRNFYSVKCLMQNRESTKGCSRWKVE